MSFCLVVVQDLVCFGFSRFQHDTLFWLDVARLIPAFLPLFWFNTHKRRRQRQERYAGTLPPRYPALVLLVSGVLFGLAAGLVAIPRLTSTSISAASTDALDRTAGVLSILYTGGVFIFLATTVIYSTTSSIYRNIFLLVLLLTGLGQGISQAIALSTSSTMGANNVSLSFASTSDVNLFQTSSQVSLGMAIGYISAITLFYLNANIKLPLPRAGLVLLACLKMIIQFALSFQPPTFALVLVRKVLGLLALFALSLEAVYSLSRKPPRNTQLNSQDSEKAADDDSNFVNGISRGASWRRSKRPDMAIRTDLDQFPVLPLPRPTYARSGTPMSAGRATLSQKTPCDPPQILWTPRAGDGPITPSSGSAEYLTFRRAQSGPPSSSARVDGQVSYGIAQGTAAPGTERQSLSPLSMSSSTDSRETDSSQDAILRRAFQNERSPTESTAGSEAIVQTAQIQQVTLSRAATIGSTMVPGSLRRQTTESHEALTRSGSAPTTHLRNVSQPTVDSGGISVRLTTRDSSNYERGSTPATSTLDAIQPGTRQRSMQAPIEDASVDGSDSSRQSVPAARSSRSGEAWWSNLHAIRESGQSIEMPASIRSSASSSSARLDQLVFVQPPPAVRPRAV